MCDVVSCFVVSAHKIGPVFQIYFLFLCHCWILFTYQIIFSSVQDGGGKIAAQKQLHHVIRGHVDFIELLTTFFFNFSNVQ